MEILLVCPGFIQHGETMEAMKCVENMKVQELLWVHISSMVLHVTQIIYPGFVMCFDPCEQFISKLSLLTCSIVWLVSLIVFPLQSVHFIQPQQRTKCKQSETISTEFEYLLKKYKMTCEQMGCVTGFAFLLRQMIPVTSRVLIVLSN